jgi:outer membrane protein assembly factor BamB/predicted Ser/Thr protein kinase
VAGEPKLGLVGRAGVDAKTVLQGRYKLERRLGAGGMSTVYLARDMRFGSAERWCAVKEILNTGVDSQTRRLNLENFVREANILASLTHQSIPKVYDFFGEDSRSYLVLEFVDGQDLEELWSKTKTPLSPRDVVGWAIQVCDVLSYLHSQTPPVIFRDVKPSNIMLTARRRIMLIDFGIAKVLQSTPKGTMIGTEGYAPPEQYRGVADRRVDVYALGATMHHLLSAQDPRLEPPFTFHERPLSMANALVSPALEEVVTRALQYDAENRYATIQDMGQALTRALGGSGQMSAPDVRTSPVLGGSSQLSGPAMRTSPALAASPGALTAAALMPVAVEQVKQIWRFRCEDEVRSSPRLQASLLYVGSYDHNLYALDVASGKFVWKYPTDGGIASTPHVTPQAVYVASEDNSLYALEPQTGQLVWRVHTRGPIRASPRMAGEVIVVGSDDAGVYAFLEDQTLLWRFQAPMAVRSSALIVGDSALVGCDDGTVYSIQMRDGRQRWKHNAGRFVISSPAYDDGLAIFGAGDSAVHAIDLRSGWSIWRVRTGGPIVSSPTVADGKVYIGSSDGRLYALEARSGRIVWQTDVGSQIASSPCTTTDRVYFGSEDGNVHALDRKTGRRCWVFKTGGMVASSPIAVDGRVYVGSSDYHVYCLPA